MEAPVGYWGLSLDDLERELWDMGNGDAIGAHYIAYAGDKATARSQMIAAFTELIDRMLYRASSYGSPWHEVNDE